jgi:ABC-type branched-subunit amino acid transport system permease subunit
VPGSQIEAQPSFLSKVHEKGGTGTGEFVQYIVNGISQGCVYVLLASGLTIILGIMNVPNFAQ